jgi:hypothetical protein
MNLQSADETPARLTLGQVIVALVGTHTDILPLCATYSLKNDKFIEALYFIHDGKKSGKKASSEEIAGILLNSGIDEKFIARLEAVFTS